MSGNEKKSIGRPTDYSEELADCICEMLMDGISLRDICKRDDMPNRATVFRWLRKYEDFSDQYARARIEMADAIFDEVLAIADDCSQDRDVKGQFNHEHVQRSKLRIDARKWMAGKLRPKVYGEKLDHTSSDGSMKPTVIKRVFIDRTIDIDAEVD